MRKPIPSCQNLNYLDKTQGNDDCSSTAMRNVSSIDNSLVKVYNISKNKGDFTMRQNKKPSVSPLSIITLIFVVPTITIYVLNFLTGVYIPYWVSIITSSISIIIGIIDLDSDTVTGERQLHCISIFSIVVSTIAISISIVLLFARYVVGIIADSFSGIMNLW